MLPPLLVLTVIQVGAGVLWCAALCCVQSLLLVTWDVDSHSPMLPLLLVLTVVQVGTVFDGLSVQNA